MYRHSVVKGRAGGGEGELGSFGPGGLILSLGGSLEGSSASDLPSPLVDWQASRGTSPGTFPGPPFIFFPPFHVSVLLCFSFSILNQYFYLLPIRTYPHTSDADTSVCAHSFKHFPALLGVTSSQMLCFHLILHSHFLSSLKASFPP